MKLISICLTVIFMVFATTVAAEDSLEISFGQANDEIKVYRLAWRKPWVSRWLTSDTGVLTGFHDFSINHWQGTDDSLIAFAYSPVFSYRFHHAPISYVMLGIGTAWLSETRIQTRQLSSHLQFEDQVGVGWQFNVYDLSLAYLHYSNGGFKHPNDGIDMVVLAFAWHM